MRTIKVFLASSEELKDERDRFGDLIRQLCDIFLPFGIYIKLFRWEDKDPCYNNVRKQDEYNAWIRQSDIFVCLFYTRAGEYTLEELNVAKQESEQRKLPKLMIFMRDLKPDEMEDANLTLFKRRVDEEWKHFWRNYPTTDKLHLDFVLFFMNYGLGLNHILKVENGKIMLENLCIANIENLPFAAKNEAYQKMKSELDSLPAKIAKKEQRMDQYPEDDEYREEHQELLNRYNALKDEFANYQKALFATAMSISEMQLEMVNSEFKRAVNEFEMGRVENSNAILDRIRNQVKQYKEQINREHIMGCEYIKILQLQAKTLMADVTIPIEKRIKRTLETYQEADELASFIMLEPKKMYSLLNDYGEFLIIYAKYEKALEVWKRQCHISIGIYGIENSNTAMSYNNIGVVYSNFGNHEHALEYYQRALDIRLKVLGKGHPDTALSYHNIGVEYLILGDNQKALKCFKKTLSINKQHTGSPDMSMFYICIGNVYVNLKKYNKALESYQKALLIIENIWGKEHVNSAMSYNNIGFVYDKLDDYEHAYESYHKALEIFKKQLGIKHTSTAAAYNNLGFIYFVHNDYEHALEYCKKAVNIKENMLGPKHLETASSYYNLGMIYDSMGDYYQALHFFQKAQPTYEKELGLCNSETRKLYCNISIVYKKIGKNDKAIQYYFKSVASIDKTNNTK